MNNLLARVLLVLFVVQIISLAKSDTSTNTTTIEEFNKTESPTKEKTITPSTLPSEKESVSSICNNNGLLKSIDDSKEEICICKENFAGKKCELTPCSQEEDPIAFQECFNGGKCYKNILTKQNECLCNGTFTGPNCQNSLCDGYCINQGRCFLSRVNNSETYEPKCDCIDDRFVGKQCQFNKCSQEKHRECPNKCYLNSDCVCKCGNDCDKAYCNEKGTCIEHKDEVACKCNIGYSGATCLVDDCDGYCFNNGSCSRTSSGLHCDCPNGSKEKRCAVNTLSNVIAQHIDSSTNRKIYGRFRIVLVIMTIILLISTLVFVLYKRGDLNRLLEWSRSARSSASSSVSFRVPNGFPIFKQNLSFSKLEEEQPITNENL